MEEIKGELKESVSETEIEKRKNSLKNFLFGWVKDNYDKVFLFILIAAFLIKIWIFIQTMHQPLWWDEAEYLATAKRWALGLNITDIWYYRRGFFWPLFCAIFFKVGLGEAGVRFSEVLFSTGIVLVSYFLIKEMFNKKYALFASIGVAFSWVLFFFTGRPMTDIPASFFLLLALLFFWKGYALNQGKKYLYLFALFFALAVLTRMESLMFLPAIFLYILMKDKFNFLKNKSLWISAGIFILLLLPLFIIYTIHFGNPITDIASHYFGVNVDNAVSHTGRSLFSHPFLYFSDIPYALFGSPTGNFTTYLLPISIIFFLFGVIYFFMDLILGFDKIFKDKFLQQKLFILLWILIPEFVLSYLIDFAEQRYIIVLLPFLFLIFLYPFTLIEKLLSKKIKNKKIITSLIVILILLLFIPNLIFGNALLDNKKTSYLQEQQAGEWINQNTNPQDIVVTNSFPSIAYYSERPIATFTRGLNNPEDHHAQFTQEEFYKFMNETKPKYILLSAFVGYDQWMVDYPLNNSNIWKPIKVWNYQQQPAVILYKSNYS